MDFKNPHMNIHLLHPIGLKTQEIRFKILPPLALYIHIPWCVSKCPYCDFNSHEQMGGLQETEYIAALIRDLELALPLVWGRKVRSIFIGGGTPSLFSGQAMEKILNAVRMLLPLDINAEITMEANPGTVETEKFAHFRAAGVNRLSLGIQSFNPAHLKSLGRIHGADEALRSINTAQQHFENINLDIMYGLPRQTLDEAVQDINIALKFAPQHISAYHLTLEPNTLFHRYPPALPDDDTSYAMQQAIQNILATQGYQHYETSAFARLKKQSRHNLNYWQFGDYLGIGAGAHSKISFHDKVLRQVRYKQPQNYLQQVALDAPVQTENIIERAELPFEFMMNALRLNQGFDATLFAERTSLPLLFIRHELEQAEKSGLLQRDLQRIAPSELGQRFLNDLVQIFIMPRK